MEHTEHGDNLDHNSMSRTHRDLENCLSNPSDLDRLRTATARTRQISIGVIGAGFAGLRCADILLRHGCNVTIVEARNRLGGRVAQSNHLGHLVDLGPNWIHGTVNNPMMTIAQESGTRLQAWDDESCVYDSDGKMLSDEETDEYNELLWDDGVIAAAFRTSNEDHDSIDPERSLHDFFADKAQTMFASEDSTTAERKRKTFLKFASMWSSYIGDPIQRQSLKFFWLEECIDGENPFVAGTYQKILDTVALPAKQEADVKLDTEVVSIRGKELNDARAELPSVMTADGATLYFDELVVTTPLGWLKNNKSAFEPPMPPRLSSAIDNISYGTLDKVYITFPSAFWQTAEGGRKEHSASGIDPGGKTPNVTAKTAPLHQPSTSTKNTRSPGFTHWLQPNYAPNTNPEKWMQDGMDLAALPPDCAHPTLLFYIQGPQSKHIGGLVASSRSEEERDKKLQAFFEPYYSLLQNYDASNPECQPKGFLATCWCNDKFAGYGSYSNFQVGLKNGDVDLEVMRHGMPERHIWLAGEHTAPFIASGTSTGAYWSGEAVAKRIVKAYQL